MTAFLLFIEEADKYDVIQLRAFVTEKLGARGRLCLAEDVYRDQRGDNPRAHPTRVGQRATSVIPT